MSLSLEDLLRLGKSLKQKRKREKLDPDQQLLRNQYRRERREQIERSPIPEEVRLGLIEERGVTCEQCSLNIFKEIDHIDGDPTNNDLDNLMLMCKSCHLEKHGKQLHHSE